MRALSVAASRAGARFITGYVRRIAVQGDRVTGVVTDRGVRTADRYVLALGVQSPLVARTIGARLAIYPAKGYSSTFPLKPQGRGTELSETVAVTSLQFRRTNQDYNLDWHPAPRRQYVITLSGESEVEIEDGKKIRLGPGHILLAEDTTGQGHISRAVGTKDRLSLFIPLADGATPPR
jgi:glycine/D-amino acid oxidase-like deaminating enzyme